MNSKLSAKFVFLFILCGIFSSVSNASLMLDSTRYIYSGDKNSLSGLISNESDSEMGAQIWIENADSNDMTPHFITTPSFFKIGSKQSQVFRAVSISKDLPKDKETVFWFNLQEIPQLKPGSGISIAIRTKVKFIYRPVSLVEGRKGAEANISLEHANGKTWLVNTTPYIFAIGNVIDNKGDKVTFSQRDTDKLSMFLPGEKVNVTGFDVKTVFALNDYGNLESFNIKAKRSSYG